MSSQQFEIKKEFKELLYHAQILRSENEIMQACYIRDMIYIVCNEIRMGFGNEIYDFIINEKIDVMLKTYIRNPIRELQLMRNVIMHTIDALQYSILCERDKYTNKANEEAKSEKISALSNSCVSLRSQISLHRYDTNASEQSSFESTESNIPNTMRLLRQVMDEGSTHLFGHQNDRRIRKKHFQTFIPVQTNSDDRFSQDA
ncbi:MAG: hypothetical protein EZS28_017149 [Streblomastix strix]|uniref:Uncharacterized protein n=1 Tax=Streblomastix strix TaxID=222440 RepID=A0A5J4VXR6_9EUKA|nr:MAG: hypothetical protein EZS28_017149 [Streblomastix strix]